ncbi:Mu transposase C-terminal domain-containing protein [Aliarcobacter skirrowii]|uniref:Mu transposase C-terminal domain-containing protein n=1 Tax=Aliarcobacter skirrowii TaxID=28200 RepID=UPI000834818D|nr:Mu transposase C-terminal domain-containing protein [Aliarcobacter skirrowii]
MGKIELKIGSVVFYKNEQYKIIRIISINQVEIENLVTHDILFVTLNELSSKIINAVNSKNYLDNYSDLEWKEANKRYEIIKDLVFIKRTKNEVEEVGKKYGYSYVTLHEWINLYEQTNEISSLVPNISRRGKKGSRLDPKIDNIINEAIEDLYLNKQKYSFRRIYNKIYTSCKQHNLIPPHENTVRNRIESLEPKNVIKRREGYKEARQQFDNFEGEFPEGNYPLEFVQIDHTPLDIRVVDNIYRKPIGRPYLTLAIDVYSRMIAGFYLSLQSPGYYNVSQCLYSVFTQKEKILHKYNIDGDWNIFGIPRIIGVDNGADLVSSDMQRVCDEYGITLMKRPVARPQFGAHIERVLGTINQEIHNLAGTTFSNIVEKGNYKSDKEAMYTLDELKEWLLHYIVNIYHKRYHSGIEMTPEQKYMKGLIGDDENPGIGYLPSIIENVEDIKISLLPTEYRTVQKDGITLDGISYYSDVLRHWIGKVDSEKSKIKHKIKRDPLNIQKIYFYDTELKEYFEIPYRKLSAPIMTLWDLYAVKKHLKDRKITNYNEDDIFEAYEQLNKIENEVKTKHNIHQKEISKQKIISIKNKELKDDSIELSSEHFNSLFEDIKIYDITSKDKK